MRYKEIENKRGTETEKDRKKQERIKIHLKIH
jgi:hypothetical protein